MVPIVMGGAQHVSPRRGRKNSEMHIVQLYGNNTDQKLFFPKSKLVYISPSNVITTLTTAINHCTNIIYNIFTLLYNLNTPIQVFLEARLYSIFMTEYWMQVFKLHTDIFI